MAYISRCLRYIPNISKQDHTIVSKFDHKSGISSNDTRYKEGQFRGGYTNQVHDNKYYLAELDGNAKIKKIPDNITTIWVGPRTRVRLYDSENFTGNSVIIENNSYDKIHLADCDDLDKVINRANIKSIYVSLLGDLEKELEAFQEDKECMSIEKFLLILLIIFFIYYLFNYKI